MNDAEFDMLNEIVIVPENIVYPKKFMLFKSTDPDIEMSEPDYLLIKQMEDGLNEEEQSRLNELLSSYPSLKSDLEIFKLTKLNPQEVVYNKKSQLVKKNIIPRVLTLIGRVAAAAAVIIFIIYFSTIFSFKNENINSDLIAKKVDTENIVDIEIFDSEIFDSEIFVDSTKTNITKQTETIIQPSSSIQKSIIALEINEIPDTISNYFPSTIEPINDIAFISKPEFQVLFTVEKINVYEKGLNLMIPHYIENHHLLAAYETVPQIENIDYERNTIIIAGIWLINRITSRNIVFERI
ncbi:MAG: hypothetical protein FWH18_05800 [Marinilabiliaceae bacterium]|nr:hypothetical protein [Marinilabiliaceae bacterium]